MKKYTQTLHLDLSPKEAFEIIVDPEAQQTGSMKVEVVKETPEGVGTILRYYYRLLGMRIPGGTYTYSEYVPGERFRWDFSRGLQTLLMGGPLASTFTFEAADGGTDVTIRPEFTTRIPVVNHLARRAMLRSWRKDLPKWKVEIEQRAKVPTKA